jgi:NADPH:quinone reductase-like Zn-dependent oxidoreductase
LIKVHYSSLNYKDALSSIGNKGVTRNIHTPGIDAVGTVCHRKQINSKLMKVMSSYDLGMNTDGGFGQLLASLKIGLLSYENLSMKERL